MLTGWKRKDRDQLTLQYHGKYIVPKINSADQLSLRNQ